MAVLPPLPSGAILIVLRTSRSSRLRLPQRQVSGAFRFSPPFKTARFNALTSLQWHCYNGPDAEAALVSGTAGWRKPPVLFRTSFQGSCALVVAKAVNISSSAHSFKVVWGWTWSCTCGLPCKIPGACAYSRIPRCKPGCPVLLIVHPLHLWRSGPAGGQAGGIPSAGAGAGARCGGTLAQPDKTSTSHSRERLHAYSQS